jgi:ABC-type antimicrobial peptide transport system permease subunit
MSGKGTRCRWWKTSRRSTPSSGSRRKISKGGVFAILYSVAFAVAIPALLLISGFGFSHKKREIGILKATGWQTQEILEMVILENVILALTAAPVSLILSFIWIRVLNAPFIGQVFISEIGNVAPFPIPSRFMPVPFMLSFFFALVLTLTGSIYSTWKAAVVSPAEAMK